MTRGDELKVREIIEGEGIDEVLRIVQVFARQKEEAAVKYRAATGDKWSYERVRDWRRVADLLWQCRNAGSRAEIGEIGESY